MDRTSYATLTPRCNQPLLLVDEDGVLSLFGFEDGSPPPGKGALIDGLPHLLSQHAADLLGELASAFECVWCTGWEDRADDYLPRLLGVPRGWPHLSFEPSSEPGESSPGHWKLAAIDAFAGPHRPLAWIDDAHNDACHTWAAQRPGRTLLVATHPSVGLTRAHARELRAWAAGLG
jgi:hypothetical protein